MHSIKELTDILGYTTDQIRGRLDLFRETLTNHTKRGRKNKILVDDNGLEILRRAKELEEQGLSLKQIPRELEQELQNNGADKETNLGQAEQIIIEEKEKRIGELKGQVQDLKQQLEKKDEYINQQARQIQQLLPAVEEGERNPLKDASLWQVIREWFKQPA